MKFAIYVGDTTTPSTPTIPFWTDDGRQVRVPVSR